MTSPQHIGRYEVVDELGRGGMATVFRAFDPQFEREVAIKVLPREFSHDPAFRARFEREARTIAQLEHVAIVPVHDYGEQDGQPFLVMRYMPGGSLADRIKQGALPPEETAAIVERIGRALDRAHQRGVIHRDIKPANVMFDDVGDAYLTDFGIVKLSEATVELTGSGIVGTPAYMAPEMAQPGGITPQVDIYALGVTLFQMLTGRWPYEADTPMGVITAHVLKPIPDIRDYRADLPDGVQAVIRRAMAKDPAERYQSAGELATDFAAVVRGEALPATLPGAGRVPQATMVEEPGDGATLLDDGLPPVATQPGPAPTRSARPSGRGWIPIAAAGVGILIVGLIGFGIVAVAMNLFGGGAAGPEATAVPSPKAGADTIAELGTSEVSGSTTSPTDEGLALPADTPLPTSIPPSYIGPVPSGARTRLGKGTINQIDLSPDGTRLAVVGGVGIYVYRADTFDEVWVGETNRPAASVAFSPDGDRILTGLADGTVLVWDSASGEQMLSLTEQTSLIAAVAWAPDGSRFATASEGGVVNLWDSETGAGLGELRGHSDGVLDVSFSPDGSTLASSSSDNTIMIWEVDTGRSLNTLRGHSNWVFGVDWAPDGGSLASASFDGKVIIWDVEQGEPLRTLEGHSGGVLDVAFSPDGERLASSDADGAIILWDAEFGDLVRTVRGHTNWVVDVNWSPDGEALFSGSFDSTVIAWNTGTGERLRTLGGHTDWVNSLAFSPDGSYLASGTAGGSTILWDLERNVPRAVLVGHTDWVNSVAISQDGQTLASASTDGTVMLWNVQTGEQLYRLEGYEGRVSSVVFSPNGRLVAAAGCGQTGSFGRCAEGAIRFWDVASGQPVGEPLTGHGDSISSIAWSPDGSRLASGSSDGTVIVWDAATGEQLDTLIGSPDAVECVVFSPDGDTIAFASSDAGVAIWNPATDAQISLIGHTGRVNSVAFSPDGSLLASGSDDTTAIVWRTRSGERLGTLEGHTSGVQSVAFSPDSTLLASASADGTIVLWDSQF